MKIMRIFPGTFTDGPGIRTSIYMAGCNHRCPGCHNPQTWDVNNGNEMTIQEVVDYCVEHDLPVTLTGGDPMYNPEECLELCRSLKKAGITDLWLYTGYTMEEIKSDVNLSTILDYVDAIVDGRFEKAQRDRKLRFKGSSNQTVWVRENDEFKISEKYNK